VKTVVPLGGEDGKLITLPAWFPKPNFEELPESIKAQRKSRPQYEDFFERRS
jgi:hypothetical protein